MNKHTTVVTERGQVSIPAVIRKELGLKAGQPLVWEKISNRECLVRIPHRSAKRSEVEEMIGFAARFRGEKGRTTAEWMAELREGER